MISRVIDSCFRTKKKQPARTQNKRALLNILELESRDLPSGFTAGDLVVYQVGNGSGAPTASGAAVFLDEYATAGGAQVQSLPTGIFANGTSTTEGYLNLATNNGYLIVPGYANSVASGNVNVATTPRAIAEVDTTGSVVISTLPGSAFGTGNIRGADSPDGTTLYAASSANGVIYSAFTSGTATQLNTTSTNTRTLSIFGGQLYADGSTSSGPLYGPGTVGSGLPTTSGQTVTQLAGFPTASGSSNYQFVFANATTIYVADDNTSASGSTPGISTGFSYSGGIQKWTYNGATWSLAYTELMSATAADAGLRGITIGADGTLYGTTSGGAGVNRLVSIVDNGASFNAPTTLATSSANEVFRGVAFVPSVALPLITSATSTTFFTGTSNTFNIVATNSPTSYAYSVVSGSIPSGINFSTSTGQFSGNPAAAGSAVLDLTATNASGTSSTQIFTLTVSAAPSITSAANTTFYTGGNTSINSFQVTATNSPTSYAYALVSGTLPTGFTFSTSTGLMTATPTTTGSPAATLSITATNGSGTSTPQTFMLNVVAGVAPTLTTTSDTEAAGLPFSFQMAATGTPSAFTFSSTDLPTGLHLTAAGVLSGNAPSSTGTFHVTASNGVSPNDTEAFTLNVSGVGAKSTNSADVEVAGPYGSAGTSYSDITGTSYSFPGFAIDDMPVPARPNATIITNVTVEFPEDFYAPVDVGGTADLFLATNTSAAYSTLKYQAGQNGYMAIDPSLSAVGLDGTNAPIGQASYTPSSANTGILTYTITSAMLTANPTLAADLLTQIQSGAVRFVVAPDTAATSYEVSGASTSPSPGTNATYTAGPAPYITSANSTTFKEGVSGQTFQVTADGNATITYSATYGAGNTSGTGAPGVTLSSAGVLSGTPTAAGTYVFTIDAHNSYNGGSDNTQTFTLTVTGPQFTSAVGVGEPYNTAFNFQFTTNPALTSVSYTGTLPTGLSLSTSGNLTGSTTLVGEFPIVVTAVTPTGNASETFYITARPQSGTTHFYAGDVVVYRAGDGSAALAVGTTSAVFLDEYSPAGILFQSIPLPTAASGSANPITNPLWGDSGFLTDSADGHSLLLAGYSLSVGTTGVTSATGAPTGSFEQTIGLINYGGASTLDSSTQVADAGKVRGADSVSGAQIYYASAKNGVQLTADGTTNANSGVNTDITNARAVDILPTGSSPADQLYVSSDATNTVGVFTVGSGLPTSGATSSQLPGLTNASYPGQFGPYEYWFTNENGGTAPDTLYTTDAVGGILKFSYNSGTSQWQADGQITGDSSTNETIGITGVETGTGASAQVTLYVTTGTYSSAAGGKLFLITDTSGFGGTITGNATSLTTFTPIVTAGTKTQFFGVALAPSDLPDAKPVFTSANSTSFVATFPGSFQVKTQTSYSDPVTAYALDNSGAKPTGVSINSSGLLVSTAATPAGTYNLVLDATNGQGTAMQSFTLTVKAAVAPKIDSANTATFLAGINGVYQVTATTATPSATFSVTDGTLPSGVTLTSTGLLEGVPTTDGIYHFTVTATNGVNPSGSQVFVLDVSGLAGTLHDTATIHDTAIGSGTVSMTDVTPEGSITGGTSFEGFGVIDITLPATANATAINSLTFQLNEDPNAFEHSGSVEVWIATGTGVSVPVTGLKNTMGGVSANQFDSSLDYGGADGVDGETPLASDYFTFARGGTATNVMAYPDTSESGLVFTISGTALANSGANVLGTLQSGGTIRLLLAAGDAAVSFQAAGAATNPAGPGPGASINYSASAATVTSVALNADAANAVIYDDGVQRSMVNSVVYTFDTPVNLDNSAIQVTLHNGVTVTLGNGSQPVINGTVGTVPGPVDNSGNGTTWYTPDGGYTWVITFANGGGTTGGGSIADGVYDIKLLSSSVTTYNYSSPGSAGTATTLTPLNDDGSGNDRETFWCLYGDAGGDQKATTADYQSFANSYLARSNNPAYVAWFDDNGDAKVTTADYQLFANNYLRKYTGFSATI